MKKSQNSGKKVFTVLLVDGWIRIYTSRITDPEPGGQKHTDPLDPASDPEHCIICSAYYFADCG
jgi:hypothetical protein